MRRATCHLSSLVRKEEQALASSSINGSFEQGTLSQFTEWTDLDRLKYR